MLSSCQNSLLRYSGTASRASSVSLLPLKAQFDVVVKARKRSPVAEGLENVLKDELKIEKERYRTPEAVLEGPPSQFELEDRPNSNVLMLARAFGSEEIYVEVDLDNQKDEAVDFEEEEDEEGITSLPPVSFMVNIVKKGKLLAFTCETTGDEVVITHVSLNDTGDSDEDVLPPYTGPLFTELDDTLQQAFTDYLEERGVNAEFGAYLVELVHDKLEVEYMNWLTRVQGFIGS